MNNPAYGKVYMNGGKSVKGHYKGHFFRSLLEYSFMKHLENEGLSLDDVGYECFTVPYVLGGNERTYCIDFYVPSMNVVYEVKPAYVLKKPSPVNVAKWFAAREFFERRGLTFVIVTEHDFSKIEFKDALCDANVIWKEKTFKYFKNTVNK